MHSPFVIFVLLLVVPNTHTPSSCNHIFIYILGSVHGGAIATALDSLLGYYTMRLLGFGCFTLNLNVDYQMFIPLGSTVRFECTTQKIEGRKAFIEGKRVQREQVVLALSKRSPFMFMHQLNLNNYCQASSCI